MSDHELEILGQKISYPKDKYGTFSIAVIGVVVVLSVYITLVVGKEATTAIANSYISGKTSDGKDLSARSYQIQFWTPSAKTISTPGDIDQKWQIDVLNRGQIEKENDQFGEKLTHSDKVSGLRRYEIYGKGRSTAKYGYWWILTVKQDYKIQDFVNEYKEYWKTNDTVYIEVYNFKGEYK